MTDLLIRGMWGLGDNIFQRPFVRAAAARGRVWLETPWPELYVDLDVRFVRGERGLRTQMRNIKRQQPKLWSAPPRHTREVKVVYGHRDLAMGSTTQAIERLLPLRGQPFVFDLPDMGPSPVKASSPIAVVRPVTIRAEWRNEARNPVARYVNEVARLLSRSHYVVAVGDLAPGQEWLDGALPPCRRALLSGELGVRELLALVRDADVVVGGVGWIVPAGIALGTKTFVILGGQGGHNAPEKITDPRMDLDNIGYAIPERFCRCTQMLHRCDKRIASVEMQFDAWAQTVGLEYYKSSQHVA